MILILGEWICLNIPSLPAMEMMFALQPELMKKILLIVYIQQFMKQDTQYMNKKFQKNLFLLLMEMGFLWECMKVSQEYLKINLAEVKNSALFYLS